MSRSPARLDRPAPTDHPIRAGNLEGIPHAFLTGAGSDGPPEGDSLVPSGVLVAPKQVHSALALVVDAPFGPGEPPQVDALVTAVPGLVLGIVTADCAPVLLADRKAGIVAAAHAGWRGAFDGVLEATVDKMLSLGASREAISAAIGPTIAQASYEVDSGFFERFVERDPANSAHFIAGRPGHYMFDLPAYVARRLRDAGISSCENLRLDTYQEAARFHSFRRATHRGKPTYGRQFSVISPPY